MLWPAICCAGRLARSHSREAQSFVLRYSTSYFWIFLGAGKRYCGRLRSQEEAGWHFVHWLTQGRCQPNDRLKEEGCKVGRKERTDCSTDRSWKLDRQERGVPVEGQSYKHVLKRPAGT